MSDTYDDLKFAHAAYVESSRLLERAMSRYTEAFEQAQEDRFIRARQGECVYARECARMNADALADAASAYIAECDNQATTGTTRETRVST